MCDWYNFSPRGTPTENQISAREFFSSLGQATTSVTKKYISGSGKLISCSGSVLFCFVLFFRFLCEFELQLIICEHGNGTEQNSGITRTKLNVNRRFKRNVHVEIITIITDLYS